MDRAQADVLIADRCAESLSAGALAALTDQELAVLVAHRRPEAAAELFARHYAATLRYAVGLTREAVTAEDLAAEAFSRALRRLSEGTVPRSFRAYLVASVRHAWIDEVRRRRQLTDLEDYRRRLGPAEHHPRHASEFVTGVMDRHVLHQAMASLTARHRVALWLTVVEGFTLTEVGDRLGINSNAVAAVVFRARHALRRALQPADLRPDTGPDGGAEQ